MTTMERDHRQAGGRGGHISKNCCGANSEAFILYVGPAGWREGRKFQEGGGNLPFIYGWRLDDCNGKPLRRLFNYSNNISDVIRIHG